MQMPEKPPTDPTDLELEAQFSRHLSVNMSMISYDASVHRPFRLLYGRLLHCMLVASIGREQRDVLARVESA